MTQNESELARTYSEMADEEILELARDPASLVEAAQKILRSELEKRGLKLESGGVGGHETHETHETLYCSGCKREVTDPLTCGSCSDIICRVCGTPLDAAWDADEDSDLEDLHDQIQVREQGAG
jgi:hypothetical protein